VDDLPSDAAAAATSGLTGYDALKERARRRNVELSESGRDIGELPPVRDPARREAAGASFRVFCESYFAHVFRLAWSQDHLKVITKIEAAVMRGGLFALAMPRGSGKSSLCEAACLWAMLYGWRLFVVLIGASKAAAVETLDSIKTELETNDLLLEDFPETIFPVHCLEGITQRANGQLYKGERTRIDWTETQIVLPTMPGSRASAAIIRVAGITGRIRGMKFTRADGATVRPDLVLPDDPQTDQSARSDILCAKREKTLAGAVLGLAGPGKKIAGVMPCTVVCRGDLADTMLDRTKHPEWQGERTKMVYAFPTNQRLWDEYAERRANSLRNGGEGREATEFYRANRAAMDEGSVVAWPERFNDDELSAIQNAINLQLADRAAFAAEYQNEPLDERPEDDGMLDAAAIAAKVSGHKRGLVPHAATHLTAFIDVQQKLLYWVVAAWADNFTGWVVDYGTWPDQQKPYFTLRDAQKTMARAKPGVGLEAMLFHGLDQLTKELCGREWQRDGGSVMRLERALIDANWGPSSEVIYQFCRQSPHATVLMPSHGKFIGASSQPFSERKRQQGEQVGYHWVITNVARKRVIRHVLVDVNHWKSFVHARLSAARGEKGCLELFGKAGQEHRLFAEQLTSEYRVRTEGRGRVVDEWKQSPDRPDNHFLDCLVGAAVAASMCGASLAETQASTPSKGRSIRLSELQAKKRDQR